MKKLLVSLLFAGAFFSANSCFGQITALVGVANGASNPIPYQGNAGNSQNVHTVILSMNNQGLVSIEGQDFATANGLGNFSGDWYNAGGGNWTLYGVQGTKYYGKDVATPFFESAKFQF